MTISSSSAITFHLLHTLSLSLYGNTLMDYIIAPKLCLQRKRDPFSTEAILGEVCRGRLFLFFFRVSHPNATEWHFKHSWHCHKQKDRTERNSCWPWKQINNLMATQKCWMHSDTVPSAVLNATASSIILMVVYYWRVTVAEHSQDEKA